MNLKQRKKWKKRLPKYRVKSGSSKQWVASEKIMKEANCKCKNKVGDKCYCMSYPWSDYNFISQLKKYKRTPIQSEQFYKKNGFTFCVIDMSYVMTNKEVVIHIFGVTDEENSVFCEIRGFKPYMYIQLDQSLIKNQQEFIEIQLKKFLSRSKIKHTNVKIEKSLDKFTTQGVSFNPISHLFKITCETPRAIPLLRKRFFKDPKILEGSSLSSPPSSSINVIRIYESNIDFVLRFLTDKKIKGSSYIHFDYNKCSWITDERKKTSRCQIEIRGNDTNFSIQEDHKDTIPPLRFCSYDAEMVNQNNHFPQPENDTVWQVCI